MSSLLVFKIIIIIDMLYALIISFLILYKPEVQINFIPFIILTSLIFFYNYYLNIKASIINIKNNKKENHKKNNYKKNNYKKDYNYNSHQSERIFNEEKDRTIKDEEEFKKWRKKYFEYTPKEDKLDKEFIILNINKKEKEKLTNKSLKLKYRLLANIYHPDKKTGDKDKMQQINDAYSILSKKYPK